MIHPDRAHAALHALHALLTAGEADARDRGDEDAARFLNGAEYLPGLMLSGVDATDRFERHLRQWATEAPAGRAALNAYLRALGQPEITERQIHTLAAAVPGTEEFDPLAPPASAVRRQQVLAAALTPGLERPNVPPRLHQDAA